MHAVMLTVGLWFAVSTLALFASHFTLIEWLHSRGVEVPFRSQGNPWAVDLAYEGYCAREGQPPGRRWAWHRAIRANAILSILAFVVVMIGMSPPTG